MSAWMEGWADGRRMDVTKF